MKSCKVSKVVYSIGELNRLIKQVYSLKPLDIESSISITVQDKSYNTGEFESSNFPGMDYQLEFAGHTAICQDLCASYTDGVNSMKSYEFKCVLNKTLRIVSIYFSVNFDL